MKELIKWFNLKFVRDTSFSDRKNASSSFGKFFKSAKRAFTLAEVLITITIVGVVAAMTIPVIHNAVLKARVESGLRKFDSVVNNALRMYIADNGDFSLDLRNTTENYQTNLKVLKQYFLPYIKYSKVEKCSKTSNAACVYFQDGTNFSLNMDGNGGDVYYTMISDRKKCVTGKNCFLFQLSKRDGDMSGKLNSTNRVEPYIFNWNKTETGLKTSYWACTKSGSRGYCTKWIQLNNWKIPKGYPYF